MHVLKNSVFQSSFAYVKEQVVQPMSRSLNDQQKKVVIVAIALFALIAAAFAFLYFLLNRKDNKPQIQLEQTQKEQKGFTELISVFHIDQKPQDPLKPTPSSLGLPQKDPQDSLNEQQQENFKPELPDSKGSQLEKPKTSPLTFDRPQKGPQDYLKPNDYTLDDFYKEAFQGKKMKVTSLDDPEFDEALAEMENDNSFDVDACESDDEDIGSPQPVAKKGSSSDGKLISLRTTKCLEKLAEDMEALGKVLGKAVDNGDCFWDAFAQGLTRVGHKVTIKELREKVSEEVKNLDQGPDEKNWVKKLIKEKKDTSVTYESYRDHVAFDHKDYLSHGLTSPIWGQEARDGVILCRLYKVNLKVHSVGVTDERPEELKKKENGENIFFTDDHCYPKGETYPDTIEMALYPGHFLPVWPKE